MKKKPAQKKNSPRLIINRWGIPLITVSIVILLLLLASLRNNGRQQSQTASDEPTPVIENPNIIPLPSPSLRSSNSIEAVLKTNQPRRDFQPSQLSLKQVGQMLWAAQGVTASWGGRTVNSEKSVFPLTVYLLVRDVQELEPGLYQYIPGERQPAHQLLPLKLGDFSETLYSIVNQTPLKQPPATVFITGDLLKMAESYGGVRHDNEVYIEAGGAIQNMYLQAESLKLGMVALPNFDEANVKTLLSIPTNQKIISIIPFGVPKE